MLVLERQRPQRLKSAIPRGKIKDIGKFKTFKKEILAQENNICS
jgi:hypothetical protein